MFCLRSVCCVRLGVAWWVVFCCAACFLGGGRTAMAGGGPEIPEPMVFDLVRGLGALKGEIEVNALGQIQLQKQELGMAWAPEIEYAVADGFAIELELPIVNTTIKALKFAAQGTFGVAAEGRFIHGLQGILEYFLADAELEIAALYLLGYRVNSVFSVFCMIGVEGSYIFSKQTPTVKGILNPTLFFEITQHLAFGLETNLAYGSHDGFSALIMPQLQFRFGSIVAIQIGVGAQYEHEKFSPVLAFRVVAQERLVERPAPTSIPSKR